MSRKKRLERLEEDHALPGEYPEATEKRRKEIRQQAEHANDCRDRELHPEPHFQVEEAGVFSSRDGAAITSGHQVLADAWYWEFLDDFGEEGGPRKLLYDPATEAFYKREPPYVMVFSRSWMPINRFFWAMGDERAYVSPREDDRVGRLDPERAEGLIASSPDPYRGEG